HRAGGIKAFQLAVAAEQQRRKVTAVRIAQATQSVAIFAKKERRKGAVRGVLVKKSMHRMQEALRLFQKDRDKRPAGISRRRIEKMTLQTGHKQSGGHAFPHDVAYPHPKLVPAQSQKVVETPANLASLHANCRIFQSRKRRALLRKK